MVIIDMKYFSPEVTKKVIEILDFLLTEGLDPDEAVDTMAEIAHSWLYDMTEEIEE